MADAGKIYLSLVTYYPFFTIEIIATGFLLQSDTTL